MIPEWFKDLLPFDAAQSCLKCGSRALTPKFHSPVMPEDWPEHLLWTCQVCGASRYTKCKDASDADFRGGRETLKKFVRSPSGGFGI